MLAKFARNIGVGSQNAWDLPIFVKHFTELGICAAYPLIATQLPEPKLNHYGISAMLNGASRYSQAT